ncbi:MAG TPA: hypothetical protein V6D47_07240 [Oscillatoriaceae cyanobacterium]
MHPWLQRIPLALAIAGALAAPAFASPVIVTVQLDGASVPEGTLVAAFSYDVRAAYAKVIAQDTPSGMAKALTPLPLWSDFSLINAEQLETFRDDFRKAHIGEKSLLKTVMPEFDAVYKKFGEQAPSGDEVDLSGQESGQAAWCRKITGDLNVVIRRYNIQHPAQNSADPVQVDHDMAAVAAAAGANPAIAYQTDETNGDGTASFDLPAGTWYFACQTGGRSWYLGAHLGANGGRIVLTPNQSTTDALDLPAWLGD